MKIIVAHCPAAHGGSDLAQHEKLVDLLEHKGHKVQLLDLPAIGSGIEALTNIASHRLLSLASCDVLVCLDPIATVLRHDRKIVWRSRERDVSADDPSSLYLANLLQSAVEEASAVCSPSQRKGSSSKGSGVWSPLLKAIGA